MNMPDTSRDPASMTDDELKGAALDVRDYFADYSEGDPYGWDWPTMRAVFPELCARHDALVDEYWRRHPRPGEAMAYPIQPTGGKP